VNPVTAVGKKCILLLACSIRNVYKGVDDTEDEAPTHAAKTTALVITAAMTIHFCALSIVSPPFFLSFVKRDYKCLG
jgi:hypothetical protein